MDHLAHLRKQIASVCEYRFNMTNQRCTPLARANDLEAVTLPRGGTDDSVAKALSVSLAASARMQSRVFKPAL